MIRGTHWRSKASALTSPPGRPSAQGESWPSEQRLGTISEYDGVVTAQLARVLCGGDLSAAQFVPERFILGLERDAFLALLHNEQTLQRIAAMLTTGKPLRN